MKLAMKRTYKKFILVLLCLLMAGNLAQGIVLCLGADGHVELGSALHERCCATVHFPSSGGSLAFYESSHEKGEQRFFVRPSNQNVHLRSRL